MPYWLKQLDAVLLAEANRSHSTRYLGGKPLTIVFRRELEQTLDELGIHIFSTL